MAAAAVAARSALLVAVLGVYAVGGNSDAKRLYDDLMSNYNRLIRPVSNHSEKVTVKLGVRLTQIIEIDLKDQILKTNLWMEHEWKDYKFSWDPAEYGGVTELYVPSEHIWLPDIILYNNADGNFIIRTMTKAVVYHDSRVKWSPPAIFASSCEMEVEYFPFDQQECHLKFGSWTHDGFQIDLMHINAEPGNDTVPYGMDLSEYYINIEWDILEVPAKRNEKKYPCCPETYPDLHFYIKVRRKPLYFIVNLIIPCLGIFYLTILVFYLPAQSGEKMALATNVLISQSFYFTLIMEIIPATSKTVPLLGRYLVLSLILIALSFVLTTLVINLHYRKPSSHTMPDWVRKLFLKTLPRVLLMRMPIQVMKDSKSRRSKFLRQSDPALKSLQGEEEEDEGENGGEESSSSQGQNLKGHLNGLYRGFTSIIQSTAQVDPDKRQVPFEVEKAMHNIMFIKHHMKRQDEFDAEDQDWSIVAMVLDRLFLWFFIIFGGFGSILILTRSPYIYDTVYPIDVTYSKIAQEMMMDDDDY